MKTPAEQFIIDFLLSLGITADTSIGDIFETSVVIDVTPSRPLPEELTLSPEGYKISYIGDNQFLVS